MASIKADEITKILKAQIANYEQAVAVEEVGTVISVGDGIARVYGLEKAMSGEMLAFPHDVFGIALNLEEDQVGAVLLGEYTLVQEGDTVKRTGTIMSAPVGEAMVGRVVNPLGSAAGRQGAHCHRVSAFRSSASHPEWWIGSRCASRCKPASKPSTR
jgi:F-type H+-transporting ATPase subunit alpha